MTFERANQSYYGYKTLEDFLRQDFPALKTEFGFDEECLKNEGVFSGCKTTREEGRLITEYEVMAVEVFKAFWPLKSKEKKFVGRLSCLYIGDRGDIDEGQFRKIAETELQRKTYKGEKNA